MSFCRFHFVLSSFLQHPDLPFAEVLPEEAIAQAFADAGVACPAEPAPTDNIVYSAAVTLWAFLSQVLYKQEQRSCVAAVARVVVLMAALSDTLDMTMAQRFAFEFRQPPQVFWLLIGMALAALDLLSLPWLAALGFVGAAGTIAFSVTAPSLVPALVPRAALAAANGRIELARSLAFAGGPALAGAHHNLGRALHAQGRLAEAETALRQATARRLRPWTSTSEHRK